MEVKEGEGYEVKEGEGYGYWLLALLQLLLKKGENQLRLLREDD